MRTIIKKATVYDGTGNFPFVADILIDGEHISKIGRDLKDPSDQVIDAEGLCLAPGFINTHSHSGCSFSRFEINILSLERSTNMRDFAL